MTLLVLYFYLVLLDQSRADNTHAFSFVFFAQIPAYFLSFDFIRTYTCLIVDSHKNKILNTYRYYSVITNLSHPSSSLPWETYIYTSYCSWTRSHPRVCSSFRIQTQQNWYRFWHSFQLSFLTAKSQHWHTIPSTFVKLSSLKKISSLQLCLPCPSTRPKSPKVSSTWTYLKPLSICQTKCLWHLLFPQRVAPLLLLRPTTYQQARIRTKLEAKRHQ